MPGMPTRVIHRIKRQSAQHRRLLRCLVMLFIVIVTVFLMLSYLKWSKGIYGVSLMSEDNFSPGTGSTQRSPQHLQLTMADLEEEDSLHVSRGLRDQSQKYLEHTFAVVASEWQALAEQPVCLATHGSVDHLHHLVDTVTDWKGPISVSVFTPDIDYQLARIYIRYLRACVPELRRKVSFHFVHPVERLARWEDDAVSEPMTCNTSARVVLEELLSQRPPGMLNEWRNVLPYPQNLMRNLARSTCPGPYVLCPDIDMVVTIDGLDNMFSEFLKHPQQKTCSRCAFIIPVYEVLEGERPPRNKTELLTLASKKKARPFHIKLFRPNQGLSNLQLWERNGQAESMNVSHIVKNFAFYFEPVYVSKRDVPQFDERFVGFGYTRNTQAYEMFVAGWRFLVLNNAFLVHWGFQNLKSRPPWRLKQSNINFRRFSGFLREVAVRYDRDPLDMVKKYASKKYNVTVQTGKVKPPDPSESAAKAPASVPAAQVAPIAPAFRHFPAVPAVVPFLPKFRVTGIPRVLQAP